MEINKVIRELRKERRLTQEQLAEVLGITAASVSKWENGQCVPDLSMLAELADYFEVSVDMLLGHQLREDRLEVLLTQADEAAEQRDLERAANLAEKILRSYPNEYKAVDGCAHLYYRLYIFSRDVSGIEKSYMEKAIELTHKLFILAKGESEQQRLERFTQLGNQYELLEQWDEAIHYYEKGNVAGANNQYIANCLRNQGKVEQAVEMFSDALVKDLFGQYQLIMTLAESWVKLGEVKKAYEAIVWMAEIMESVEYQPKLRMVLALKLIELSVSMDNDTLAEENVRKAAALAIQCDSGECEDVACSFLQPAEPLHLLTNIPNISKELVLMLTDSMGEHFGVIAREELAKGE